MRFFVKISPLVMLSSSFRELMSDLLILPLNLNLDNLFCSFMLMLRNIMSSIIFSIKISTSENNPCFHKFLIAEEILSLGIVISSPTFRPEISRRVFLFKF